MSQVRNMISLLDGQNADGNSEVFDWPGGVGIVVGAGTFDSGTLSVQFSPNNGTTWVASEATLTANGRSRFELPPCKIRLNLTGSTSPDLNAWIAKVTPSVR